jgi:hypothetical protein
VLKLTAGLLCSSLSGSVSLSDCLGVILFSFHIVVSGVRCTRMRFAPNPERIALSSVGCIGQAGALVRSVDLVCCSARSTAQMLPVVLHCDVAE